MDTNADVGILMTLAELDERKRALELAVESIPPERAKRAGDLQTRKADFERASALLEAAKKERRELERLIQDRTQLLGRYRAQLDGVKTNKEYQSIQLEIENTRVSVLKAEDRLLELMDRLERVENNAALRKNEFDAAAAATAAADAETDGQLADVQLQLLEVEEKRTRLLPQLSPGTRSVYQQVYDHYRGGAFAVCADGVCQGCFVNIPAKIVSELQAGGRWYRCESCGRFIMKVSFDWKP